jgi:hypothetical protein
MSYNVNKFHKENFYVYNRSFYICTQSFVEKNILFMCKSLIFFFTDTLRANIEYLNIHATFSFRVLNILEYFLKQKVYLYYKPKWIFN